MEIVQEFGFVTGCHNGDKLLVQGTLASIRHFCPDAPICLVADGGVDVRDLQPLYDLLVLRPEDLPNRQMRKLCYGNFYAKMATLWEGPFEYGVWLDADALLWGDITPEIRLDCDFHIFSCNGVSDLSEIPFWLTHYQHDPRLLAKFDAQFDWRRNPYFCSGTFGFRRGVVPFDMWQEVHEWRVKEPKLFAWGEMGMLNYCVHSLKQQGAIKVAVSDLQHLRSEQGIREYVEDLSLCGWRLPTRVARPRVGHFSGNKPFVHERRAYSKPFTIARLEHHRRSKGELAAWCSVLAEEWPIYRDKVHELLRKVRSRAKRIFA